MKTTYKKNISKYILSCLITSALSATVQATTIPDELVKVQPVEVYQTVSGTSLQEALLKVATRSGITFKVNADISKDVLMKTVSADSWDTAVAKLLEGYNFAVIKDGSKIEKVIVIGRGQFGEVKSSTTVNESSLITVSQINERLPSKYDGYPVGSVVTIDLPVVDIMKVADNSAVTLDLPMGKIAVMHEKTTSEYDGSNIWVGHLQNEGYGYHVFVSQGNAGVMGHINTPDGTYNIESAEGKTFLIDTKKLTDAGFENDSVAAAPVLNGATQVTETVSTAASAATVPNTANATIDLTTYAKSVSDAQAALNNAAADLTAKQNALTNAQKLVSSLTAVVASDATKVTTATTNYNTTLADTTAAKAELDLATANYNTAKANLMAESTIKTALNNANISAQATLKVKLDAVTAANAANNAAFLAYIKSNTAATLAAKDAAAVALNKANSEYTAARTAANSAAAAVGAEIPTYTTLNSKFLTANSKLVAATSTFNSKNAFSSNLLVTLNTAKSTLATDTAALSSAKTTVTKATSDVAASTAKLTAAQTAYNSAKNLYDAAVSSASAGASSVNEIDVMVVYTTGSQTADFAKQRIAYLVSVSNKAYADSGVNMSLRLVHTEPTSYVEANSNTTALYDLAGGNGAFSTIKATREKYGADLVYLFRPLWASVAGSCGSTFVEFANGSLASAGYAFGTIGDGVGKDIKTSYCNINAFTHEIGHSMGLVHDVEYSGGVKGVFADSYAWGVSGKFATIMSYKSPVVMYFANPDLKTQCAGQPCGTTTANQTKSLAYTAPILSKFLTKTTITPVIN